MSRRRDSTYASRGIFRRAGGRRNRRCKSGADMPIKRKRGYVRVCATYYYWKGRR